MGTGLLETEKKFNLMRDVLDSEVPTPKPRTFKTPAAVPKTRTYTTPGVIQVCYSNVIDRTLLTHLPVRHDLNDVDWAVKFQLPPSPPPPPPHTYTSPKKLTYSCLALHEMDIGKQCRQKIRCSRMPSHHCYKNGNNKY